MCRLGAVVLPLIGVVLLNILGHCETSIYPGLRRKPVLQDFDVPSDDLAQLMEDFARRRLHQQFSQQLGLIKLQMARQRQHQEERERYRQQQLQRQKELELEEEEEDEERTAAEAEMEEEADDYNMRDNSNIKYATSEFSFKYPNLDMNSDILRQRIPFAVGPSDPRFFEENNRADTELDSRALDDYEEYVPAESKTLNKPLNSNNNANKEKDETLTAASDVGQMQVLTPVETAKSTADGSGATTFHRIKPQSAAAAAAVAGVSGPGGAAITPLRHDINALINKLQKEGKSSAIINEHDAALGQDGTAHMVFRQHLGMESEMNMYLVALIAGVSAAITVGLIALGLAWLHNRTKATADVEYPAYGVTGPNKDISPSGDRKLAQSAQMYHYQHQKQQIIAMKNRQAVEGSCGLSDVESDDDNEEGDYTVYECPGLAPQTGEMEVKNPLFLDETPLTPSSNTPGASTQAQTPTSTQTPIGNVTQATSQQQQQQQQQPTQQVIKKIIVKSTPPSSTSSDDKQNKKKSSKK